LILIIASEVSPTKGHFVGTFFFSYAISFSLQTRWLAINKPFLKYCFEKKSEAFRGNKSGFFIEKAACVVKQKPHRGSLISALHGRQRTKPKQY
jgi:hypothetical protein